MDRIIKLRSTTTIKVAKTNFDKGQVCLAYKGVEIDADLRSVVMKHPIEQMTKEE